MKLKHVILFENFSGSNMKLIKTTYQKFRFDDESDEPEVENGWLDDDGQDMTPDELDIEDGITAVDNAISLLQRNGAIHASSYPFSTDCWYSTETETDVETGENTIISYHLSGFSVSEQKTIYDKIIKKIKESKRNTINKKYTHFAVLKSNDKIVNGWNYKGYDHDELYGEKEHYFYNDLRDMDIDKKDVSIFTTKQLQKLEIDPFDFKYWQASVK